MQFLKKTLISVLILLPEFAFCQSEAISTWAEQKQGFRKLCFYPTTLRMVNITKDESYNAMIKDIDKLKLFISDNPERIFKKEDLTLLRKNIKAEHYEDMIQMNQGKQSFYIFIKEKHHKPVAFAGIVYSEKSLILIDLEGYISPEVINRLITGKINFGAISKLYDITKIGQENKK